MKVDFTALRQALEEHLSAINENTAEIQALFDYVHELEVKMDKLSQRLDQVQLQQDTPLEKTTTLSLNQTEKKIFLVLYTAEGGLSYQEIASRSGLPFSLIPECISSLVHKGIPLQRFYCHNQLFFKLNPEFKELQAKENIVNLSLQSFME